MGEGVVLPDRDPPVRANLNLEIRDDGIGGAAPGKGSGLTGLVDRVEALGGKVTIQSQAERGTSLLVNIPIETD
jgi:signal transduction histidine kinase